VKIVILLALAIMSFISYQNCAENQSQYQSDEFHPEKTQEKTLAGVVDVSKPVNLRPSRLYQAVEDGIDIDLDSGEVLRDPTGNWMGLCLDPEMTKDLMQLLQGAEVCQDVPITPAGGEVVCTMDLAYPHAELFLSIDNHKVALGRGNECPRTPTKLCKNNEALLALLQNIEDRHFQSCVE